MVFVPHSPRTTPLITGELRATTAVWRKISYYPPSRVATQREREHHGITRLLRLSQQGWPVRRLTPRECERLQGFPDDYTKIPYRVKPAEECPDGPRYKALGNSMAVPVMHWIGGRIAMIDALT